MAAQRWVGSLQTQYLEWSLASDIIGRHTPI
ncbi:uncharacterized protein CPUR_06464 [Claviceps purpurea 20.1]|uniref:Uncharacterized protein n=1 Tax=Claviceps purpurea (strain 20.1) TaxID=1111077 RepID=M1VX89_CLAP2|nr:uncharacterized protein CPUR_06464 [Claviceps purpurea 20.1]